MISFFLYMATIFETLENANYNLNESKMLLNQSIGKEQLKNAMLLLNKGYELYEDVDELLLEYSDINKIPQKIEENE